MVFNFNTEYCTFNSFPQFQLQLHLLSHVIRWMLDPTWNRIIQRSSKSSLPNYTHFQRVISMEAAAKVVQYAPDNAMNMYAKKFALYALPLNFFILCHILKSPLKRADTELEHRHTIWSVWVTPKPYCVLLCYCWNHHRVWCAAKPPCHIHPLTLLFLRLRLLAVALPPPSLLIALFLSLPLSPSLWRSLDYIKLHLWLAGTSTIKSQPSSFVWKTKVPPPKRFYNNSTLLYFASLCFTLCSSYVPHMAVERRPSSTYNVYCSLCRRYVAVITHRKKQRVHISSRAFTSRFVSHVIRFCACVWARECLSLSLSACVWVNYPPLFALFFVLNFIVYNHTRFTASSKKHRKKEQSWLLSFPFRHYTFTDC